MNSGFFSRRTQVPRSALLIMTICCFVGAAASAQNSSDAPPSITDKLTSLTGSGAGAWTDEQIATMHRIRDAAINDPYAYNELMYLTDSIGPRLACSPQAEAAVQSVAKEMRALGTDVSLEQTTVPHWVRGQESACLTAWPGMTPDTTRWSPDGKNIVFLAIEAGKPPKIYEVSPEGGSPQQLLPDESSPQVDPNWSPHGDKIVFSSGGGDPASSIHILDLTTHQITTLQGSRGLFSSRWSPDGRYRAALSVDQRQLLLFDFRTQKWTEVAKGRLGWPGWSKDGQYLYVQDATGTGALIKILLGEQKTERIVDLKNFVPTSKYYPPWSAVAPDDSPLLLRDAGSQNVYSLDWKEP